MTKLSDNAKKDLKKLAEANKRRKATAEDLAKIIHPYLPAEVQIQEESVFMQRARVVLKPPEPEPTPPPTPQTPPEPVTKEKPQLSALEKVVVWFTTKLEALSQRLEQGHGSGVNADKLDSLEAEELMVRAANMANRGRGGGTLTTDHGLLMGLDDPSDHLWAVPTDGSRILADVGYPNAVLRDGSRVMTGDLDIAFTNILTTNLAITEKDANTLTVMNRARTEYRDLYARSLILASTFYPAVIEGGAHFSYFRTKETPGSRYRLQGYTGAAYANVAEIRSAATPYIDIHAAGAVTMLDQKMMQFGTYTDAQRPAAGTAGRWIFNTDDGMPNYDDGANWRDINGNIT